MALFVKYFFNMQLVVVECSLMIFMVKILNFPQPWFVY